MIDTRISSDPDLTYLADKLYRKDVSQLHELSIMLIERGTELVSLDDALAGKVSDFLRKGKQVPTDVLERLQAEADEADGHYLDILDAEGAESRARAADLRCCHPSLPDDIFKMQTLPWGSS